MKDYHFENDNKEFDTTIRLDHINEKVKELEQNQTDEDDLGDKDEFLNAFESEKFEDPLPIQPAEEPVTFVTREPRKQPVYDGGQPPMPPKDEDDEEDEPFWNKKTVGLITIAALVVLGICFGIVKMVFFSNPLDKATEAAPMLVTDVLDEEELLVYDINAAKQKTVNLTPETVVYNEDEVQIQPDIIQMGDLLMIQMDQDDEFAVTISYDESIKKEEITGLKADTSAKELQGEDRSFAYDKKTIFYYDEEEIRPEDIESCDVLEISGIGDVVWSVKVLEYHGYITVENAQNIKNGTFTLDEEEPVPLSDVEKIAVKEGTHSITIKGDNIESRTDSVLVQAGETTVYDLSKAQQKMGVLAVNANVSDYKLYINGALVDSSQPSVLPFGEYDVVILKNGYKEWSQTVTLNQDAVSVNAQLEAEEQLATVVINCNESDANVFINGEERGTAPLQVTLPYGTYEVEVFKDGFTSYHQTVQIQSSVVHISATLG